MKPANAFEWKRYTEEEREREGGKPQLANTDYRRSVASSKVIERLREGNPSYGTLGMSAKTQQMVDLRPKNFTVYSKAGK
jgi:hypothetical protein